MSTFDPAAGKSFRLWEKEGRVHKTYWAIVRGELTESMHLARQLLTAGRKHTGVASHDDPDPTRHTLVEPVGVLAHPFLGETEKYSLVRVGIKRGARHQIRAHLSAAGFPLVGDPLYGEHAARHGEACEFPFCLHHSMVRFPGFMANVLPTWGFGAVAHESTPPARGV